MRIGAYYLGNGRCTFTVWAPFLKNVALRIVSTQERVIPMKKNQQGYWHLVADDVQPGTRYLYRLQNSSDYPDPASFCQPRGVHEVSEIVDHTSFRWDDKEWSGIPLNKMIIYEIHVGTFTPQGTFEAIIPRLDELSALGINTIEIMPVAQFPGERNWGYDGTYPFAVQNSYGGPMGLQQLVNACHKKGFAVILDVVYNHLGPEGNYLEKFGPYFTKKYKTPWGKAINFDDAYSDEVRNFFVQNALYWFLHYHIDALRVDAIHGIYDMSAKHILKQLAEAVEEFSKKQGRKFCLVAESDLNDTRVIREKELGGYGIDAQWCDDFHHSVHTLLTGEQAGYYLDFGKIEHLAKAYREGFVYSWEYSAYRRRHHGSSSKDIPGRQFVVFTQNHDQVGNRMLGERLSQLVSYEALKLAAGALFISPFVPLLFMGEEYAEETPFLYFVSHSDSELIKAVREGRKSEFVRFEWKQEPPDPQSEETFVRSKLNWAKRREGKHKTLLEFNRQLIQLRKEIPALACLDKNNLRAWSVQEKRLVFLHRWHAGSQIFSVMNFHNDETSFDADFLEGKWAKVIDSADTKWLGPGSMAPDVLKPAEKGTVRALNFVLYTPEAYP